jgi:hypothetical protein
MIMDGYVLGAGPAGRCDDFRVGGGVVDHDPISGLWRMWYYCRDHAYDRPAPGTLGSGRVAMATSKDGMDWTRVDGPAGLGAVFAPSDVPEDFDSSHVGLTDITRGAGEWLMWYFGGSAQLHDTGGRLGAMPGIALRPGLARSVDGLNWTRVRGTTQSGALVDIDQGMVYAAWPNVFDGGGRMIMQYSAPIIGLGHYDTRSATSYDGHNWTKHGAMVWADGFKPWDCTGMITRQVLPNPGLPAKRFVMIYTGTDEAHARSVAAAHSDDGMTWEHLGDGPIFGVGHPDAWDCTGVAATRMVAANGKLHLYYYGFQSLGNDGKPRGIGLAVSETGSLSDLKRVERASAP